MLSPLAMIISLAASQCPQVEEITDFGYTGSCSAVATGAACDNAKCSQYFKGPPDVECEGTQWSYNGCAAYTCSGATDPHAGYVPGTCTDTCSVTCAEYYHATAQGAAAVCAVDGGKWTFTGCDKNTCSGAAVSHTGYVPGTCDSTGCPKLACADYYMGTPTAVCAADGGKWTFQGCAEANCQAFEVDNFPKGNPGYTGHCTTTTCILQCADDYTADPNPIGHCAKTAAMWTFTGCKENAPANNCPETDAPAGYTGTCKANIPCLVDCDTKAGWTGKANATCVDKAWDFDGCKEGAGMLAVSSLSIVVLVLSALLL